MTYHYEDVKDRWNEPTDEKIGWDVPMKIAKEYSQKIMVATVALSIGYFVGKSEWKKGE